MALLPVPPHLAYPLFFDYHSFRVYLHKGEIDTPEYALSISEGYLELVFPLALSVSDATLIQSFLFLVDDDETQLIDDDAEMLVEDF